MNFEDTQGHVRRGLHHYKQNEYTKLDPTLPRTNTIRCPNSNCETNKTENAEREIIYIRYDDTNMKYVYMCSTCDSMWKTDESV